MQPSKKYVFSKLNKASIIIRVSVRATKYVSNRFFQLDTKEHFFLF